MSACSDDDDGSDDAVRFECRLPAPTGDADQNGTLTVGDVEFEIMDSGRNEAMNRCSAQAATAARQACARSNADSVRVVVRYDDVDGRSAEQEQTVPCG